MHNLHNWLNFGYKSMSRITNTILSPSIPKLQCRKYLNGRLTLTLVIPSHPSRCESWNDNLNFDPVKTNEIFSHSSKEHLKISNTTKFGSEMSWNTHAGWSLPFPLKFRLKCGETKFANFDRLHIFSTFNIFSPCIWLKCTLPSFSLWWIKKVLRNYLIVKRALFLQVHPTLYDRT